MLVLAAVLPFAGLLAYNLYASVRVEVRQAEAEAMRAARVTAL